MFERLADHHRTKVGTSDADIDNSLDSLAGVPLPSPTAHGVSELLYVFQDFGNFINTSLGNVIRAETAKSDMKDCTILRGVDMFASEHLVTVLLDTGFTNQIEEGV
jgi:hypothetical protein